MKIVNMFTLFLLHAYVRASKPVDIPYETYYSEKDDHIYITEEIELADLKNKLNDENAVIFKVRG